MTFLKWKQNYQGNVIINIQKKCRAHMDPPGCGLHHALYFTNQSIKVLRNQVIFLIRWYIQYITNYKLEPISWLPSSVCSIKMHCLLIFYLWYLFAVWITDYINALPKYGIDINCQHLLIQFNQCIFTEWLLLLRNLTKMKKMLSIRTQRER